jgi:hypothetical protein
LVTTKLDPENRNESKSKTLDISKRKKVRIVPWNAGRPGEMEKREPFFRSEKKIREKIPGFQIAIANLLARKRFLRFEFSLVLCAYRHVRLARFHALVHA